MNLIGKEFIVDNNKFIVESLFSQSEKLYVCRCLNEPSYKNTYTYSEKVIIDELNKQTGIVLDCKVVRNYKLKHHKEEISKLSSKPKLLIIQANNNHASDTYVRNKMNRCIECGIEVTLKEFDESITENELIKYVDFVQDLYDAIIPQSPMYNHINEKNVISHIHYTKDCDGLNEINIGKLHNQDKNAIIPATAQGILDLFDYYKIDLTGKNVLIVGRSLLVSRPLQEMLTQRDCTVTMAHSKTKNLQYMLSSGDYDIVVSAIGKAKELRQIEAEYIIDVGINRDENGKLCGDVDIDTCKCKYYTPVPSGCGLLTQETIVGNVLKCYELQHK